jgi:hypothetical protein
MKYDLSPRDFSSREFSAGMVETINSVLSKDGADPRRFLFEIAGPCNVTTKNLKGEYRTRALIGNETFILTGCYLGKIKIKEGESGIIFVAKPCGLIPSLGDGRLIEIPARMRTSTIKNWWALFEKIETELDDTAISATQEMLRSREEKRLIAEAAARQETLRENPDYGTW